MTDVLQGVPSLFEICWEGILCIYPTFHQMETPINDTATRDTSRLPQTHYVTLIVVMPSWLE